MEKKDGVPKGIASSGARVTEVLAQLSQRHKSDAIDAGEIKPNAAELKELLKSEEL